MDRINSDNIGYDAQGRRIFKDGPPATTINDQWCNGVQEELMAVIESEGFAGSVSDNTLLLKSITAAIARATDNYVTVHDLGTKNIVSQYSSFNLDLYISGGLLAKPSGWRCRIACSDGNGSYYCDPSTAYNINGISALNYRMYGTGNYIFELENQTGNWKIIEDNTEIISSLYTNSSGVGANTIINFSTKIKDNHACVTTGASWKWICKKSGWYLAIETILSGNPAGNLMLYKGGAFHAIGSAAVIGNWMSSSWVRYIAKDEYIDFRFSGTSSANAEAFCSITELRS